jgi:hypothetical protein
VKAGLKNAGNGRNVRNQTASSPESQIEAVLILGESAKSLPPIAFPLPFDRRDD